MQYFQTIQHITGSERTFNQLYQSLNDRDVKGRKLDLEKLPNIV